MFYNNEYFFITYDDKLQKGKNFKCITVLRQLLIYNLCVLFYLFFPCLSFNKVIIVYGYI